MTFSDEEKSIDFINKLKCKDIFIHLMYLSNLSNLSYLSIYPSPILPLSVCY